jgi:periplasmic protein TonB
MTRVRHTLAYGAGLTVLLHGALFAALMLLVPPRPAAMRRYERVRVRLAPPRVTPPPAVATPRAPAPPPAAPPPARAKAPPPPRAAPPPAPRPAAAPPPAAPPVAAPPAAPAPPAPRRFAVSLEATVPGGGVAVPTTAGPGDVGGTPGAPRGPGRLRDDGASSPGSGPGVRGGAPGDLGSVTQRPGLLGRPSDAELRAAYPEAARRQGLDGDVKLEILVDEAGRVTRVRVVRPAGNGFDEAADRLIRRHRFRPAQQGGRAVAVWIPWTYKFRLED